MITPRFWCLQDHNFVVVKMRLVHVKLSEMQFAIEGRRMTFHAAPYFLRLTFDQDVVEDETARASFDVELEMLTAFVPKRNKGEVFTDLDCTTKLLTTEMERKKMVEDVTKGGGGKKKAAAAATATGDAAMGEAKEGGDSDDDDEEEEEEAEEELDFEMKQMLPDEENLGEYYGFNDEFTKFFAPLQEELPVCDIAVDTTPIQGRIRAMHQAEAEKFVTQGTDHYLADFMDDAEIKELLTHTPSYYAKGVKPPTWDTLKNLGDATPVPTPAGPAAATAGGSKIQVISSSTNSGANDDDDDDAVSNPADVDDLDLQAAAAAAAQAPPAVTAPACLQNIVPPAGEVPVDMKFGGKMPMDVDAGAAAAVDRRDGKCYPTMAAPGVATASSEVVGTNFVNPGDIGRAEVLQTGSGLTGFFHTRVDKDPNAPQTTTAADAAVPGQQDVQWDCAKEVVGEDKPGESCPPHPEAFHESQMTSWEREEMLRLPKKRYLVVNDDAVFCGLIDLLACYCYDHITTMGEGNAESVWTFTKLSPTLSYVVKLPTLRHVIVCFLRRVVTYPLFRHVHLARRCLWDVAHILSRGDKILIVRMLLRIKWHLDRDEFKYPLSKLYVAPYATWIQSVSPEQLMRWGSALAAALAGVKKADIGLPLGEIEALGSITE